MFKFALIVIALLVIYGVFAFQNQFNNAKVTAIRGGTAILVGWVIVILASLLVSKVDISALTTAAEIATQEENNTARMRGAVFFGWAYPLILIELIWGGVYFLRFCREKNILISKLQSVK